MDLPTKNTERIAFLDVLRGIAILFIFVANVFVFSGWLFLSEQAKINLGDYSSDRIIEFLYVVFVQGKFYSIFSILFGIGFVILSNNAERSDKSIICFYLRRMFGLFIIGMIHLIVFWNGDILALYALLGIFLLFFRNTSDKTLLVWAVILFLMPVLSRLFIYLTEFHYYGFLFRLQDSVLSNFRDLPTNVFLPIYQIQTESVTNFFKLNLGNPFRRFGYFLYEGRQFKVLGCFLIGIWAGRKILFENLLANNSLLKKIAIIGFAFGLPFNFVLGFTLDYRNEFWILINSIFYSIGVITLACAYSAAIALFYRSKSKLLNIFIPVGQMALTNYLFQTFISIIVFYGIGFGLGTNLSLTKVMFVLLFIFIFQIMFSRLWLSQFRYGPIEWIWRQAAYLKYLEIRR